MQPPVVIEKRDYVPHPLPILFAGVLVLAVGFWINLYLTGKVTGYSGHGLFLLLLGTITVFASAGSVDTGAQWKFSIGLIVAFLGSSVLTSSYPELSAVIPIEQLHIGLQMAAIIVGLLAFANTAARYRIRDNPPEDRILNDDL